MKQTIVFAVVFPLLLLAGHHPSRQISSTQETRSESNVIPDFEGTANFVKDAVDCPAVVALGTPNPFHDNGSLSISYYRLMSCWKGTLKGKKFILDQYMSDMGGGLAVRYGNKPMGTISTQAPPWIVRFTGEIACDRDHANHYRALNLRTGQSLSDDEALWLCALPDNGAKYVFGLKNKYKLDDAMTKWDLKGK